MAGLVQHRAGHDDEAIFIVGESELMASV